MPETRPHKSAKKKSAPHKNGAEAKAGPAPRVIPVEVSASIEETLKKLRGEVEKLVNKGRFTRVRFKVRGKQILPDLPLAAVVAAEAATFWWAGLLRALAVNVAGKAFFDMELVSEADEKVAAGKSKLVKGDVEGALAEFRRATEMDSTHPEAWLQVGIACKLMGNKDAARAALGKVKALDPKGTFGVEAENLLRTLG